MIFPEECYGKKKIIVCGGRGWDDITSIRIPLSRLVLSAGYRDRLRESVISGIMMEEGIEFIVGDAPGVDKAVRGWPKFHPALADKGWSVRVFEADWTSQGKAAGPIRNQRMALYPGVELCVAFSGGRGTANMISTAIKYGIPVLEITPNKEAPNSFTFAYTPAKPEAVQRRALMDKILKEEDA